MEEKKQQEKLSQDEGPEESVPFEDTGKKMGFKRIADKKVELAVPDLCVQPIVARGIVIGAVDEVNGPGAVLMRDFTPSRHEVALLVKYWARVKTDFSYSFWFDLGTGSSACRRDAFANRRLDEMVECLGTEEVRRLYQEAEDEFGSEQHPKLWAKYLNGEEPERDQEGFPIIE